MLLDTCVYIDQSQDRSPEILDRLVATRLVNHSTIAIQELMHAVGILDPTDPRTPGAVAEIRSHIQSMMPHRIFAPDADVLARAALVSGIVCRLQGYGPDRKLRALHDCVLMLHARKLGLTLLTRDVADFDILLQLLRSGSVLFYRRE